MIALIGHLRPGLTPSPRTRRNAILAAVAGIVLIGLTDTLTGEDFSLAMFYLVPVSFAALVVTTADGVALSLLAAVARTVDETIVYGNPHYLTASWNCLGRFISVSVIVYLIGALRLLAERLADSERTSKAFLATAAHQLRTPIAGLIASAEALSVETEPEARSRLLDNLVAGTNRSRRLISSMLVISRLDHPTPVELRPTDVAEVCRREVDATAMSHAGLSINYSGPTSIVVESDEHALQEAVSNLLDNATRHAAQRIDTRVGCRPGEVVISVSDDGSTVPVGLEARIFEPFVSLDGAGGSGLGLSIARASIRQIGGELRYERPAFVIRLPA